MALSNHERKIMKDLGRVYNRSLNKWMTPSEIEKHNSNERNVENAMTIIGWITAICIFIWILTY
jgi:hypothetical protein